MSAKLERKITKKSKRIIISLGALLLLFFLLLALVFIPPIQNRIVSKVTQTLSENWGSDIKIGNIYISPTLKVVFSDLVINDLQQNAMIKVDKVKTRIKEINFTPFELIFYSLEIDGAEALFTKYLGDESVNIGMWARSLKKSEEKGSFSLHADRLLMTNSRFLLHNENTITDGDAGENIDYGFFELNDITFKTKDFNVNRDDISAQITKLAFSQYSGFSVLEANAFFRINSNGLTFNKGKIATAHSIIYFDLHFDYDNWSSYASFTDSVMIRANINPSVIHFSDISRFSKALNGMDQYVVFSGTVNGTVNSMYVHDFSIFFKETNALRGSLYMKDITDFKNGYYDLNLHKTTINIYDLTKFLLPGGRQTPIPKELYPMGNTNLELSFKGDFSTFAAKLNLHSQLGSASAQLALYEAHGRYLFDGKASSPNFNIGKVIQSNDLLGNVAFNIALDGYSLMNPRQEMNIEDMYANLSGNIQRFDLLNYPIRDISLNGMLNGKKFDGHIHSADTNLNFTFNGVVDLTNEIPNFRSYISVARFAPEQFAKNYPIIDSVNAKGLSRAIYMAQQNPDLTFSFDSLEFNISGDQLNHLNGFAGVDGIFFSNGQDSIYSERIRLTAISTQTGIHRFILTSNFANVTVSTNYQLNSLLDSLMTVGHRYLPNIIPAKQDYHAATADIDSVTGSPKEYYFQLSAETFRTRELFDLLLPGVQIAPRSICDLYIGSTREKDSLHFNTRRIVIRDKFRLYAMDITGRSSNDSVFNLILGGDSIVIAQENSAIHISDPKIMTEINNNLISYHLQWSGAGLQNSWLSGYVDATTKDSIAVKILSSSLYFNDDKWQFNDDHKVTILKEGVDFHNVLLGAGESTISAHGLLSFRGNDNLDLKIKNVALTQINNFTSRINLSFGGDISAAVKIGNWNNKRLFTGKVLVSDFIFNNAEMGNLFVTAAVPENTNIAFAGGLFKREEPFNSASIAQYSIRNYNMENHILANMSGFFETEERNLLIKATIDTLELGFLAPFFKSFSHRIDGKAQGELTFHSNPDSAYLDGRVKVLDGYLGISPLNTVYRLINQDIIFNHRGIEFPDVEIVDFAGNRGKVTGGLYHQLFKNFVFDINIETNRLLVLNTEKAPDVSFYGTGFAEGRVRMEGNTDFLRFHGTNLRTLQGTRLNLPVMFSDRVSETDGIRFKTATPLDAKVEEKMSTIMDFNFTFDVTRDAEVFVELDPAIGGTLAARTEGTLQVHYNTETDLTLKGLVTIMSGNYQMSFRDLFLNLNMQLVEGGTVTFDGGISNSIIDAKALHRTMAPIHALDNEMPTGRTQVNAYLLLSGILMNPSINFEFEFPNLDSEDNLRLNTAMNSDNVNSAATQFFSLVLTSNFINSGNIGESREDLDLVAGVGTELFSGILNNLLFSNMDFFDEFGMNIRNAGQLTNDMEFSLGGKKTIDRWILQGDIGYRSDLAADASNTGNANNIIYDFSIEYLINRSGNLRARAFVSSGNYDLNTLQSTTSVASIIAGGSIIFKVDFNNGADITNAFRRQKKMKETTTKKEKK